jgi:hypothetical protein
MPLREAEKRAGSVEALLPHLRGGRIMTRHGGLYRPSSGAPQPQADDRIPAGWWANARDIDPATGRVLFAVDPLFQIVPAAADTLAIGIELERAAVEALWPAKPKSSESKRGAKPSAAWAKVQPHFDHLVDCDGPFPSLGSARDSVKLLLKEKKLGRLNDRTIERWINKHRPQWVRGA